MGGRKSGRPTSIWEPPERHQLVKHDSRSIGIAFVTNRTTTTLWHCLRHEVEQSRPWFILQSCKRKFYSTVHQDSIQIGDRIPMEEDSQDVTWCVCSMCDAYLASSIHRSMVTYWSVTRSVWWSRCSCSTMEHGWTANTKNKDRMFLSQEILEANQPGKGRW